MLRIRVPSIGNGAGPAQSLTPLFFADADAVFVPAVAPGPVTITPRFLADGDAVFVPLVALGAVTIRPLFFADADAVFVPVLAPGPVTITPLFLADRDAVFVPFINFSARPPDVRIARVAARPRIILIT